MDTLRRNPELSGVICHKVDRLLRNFPDYALVDDYIQAGIQFQFVSGSYDNTPAGKLSLGMQVLVAKHYIDNLSGRNKEGPASASTGRAPVGLRSAPRLPLPGYGAPA